MKTPYSVRIQENTDQKKLCIWTLFTQLDLQRNNHKKDLKPDHISLMVLGLMLVASVEPIVQQWSDQLRQ